MPRIRRWHPVSHDFVRDPEVKELRRRFGDWSGYLWLEMLSIADRNNGLVKGAPEEIARALSFVCVTPAREVLDEMSKSARRMSKWSPVRARKVFVWMQEKDWIVPDKYGFLVRNYLEYHLMRGTKKSRQGIKDTPSEPPEPPEHRKRTPYKVSPNGFEEFWTKWPNRVKKGAALKAWGQAVKHASPDQIVAGLDRTLSYITRSGGKYMPNPATWLNADGWEDEPPPESVTDEPRYHWEKPT